MKTVAKSARIYREESVLQNCHFRIDIHDNRNPEKYSSANKEEIVYDNLVGCGNGWF